MKKAYINPEILIIMVKTQKMLAASNPPLGGEYSGGTVLSPEFEFDDEY